MAEIFGAVAAGIAVCHEITRLAEAICKIVKDIKNAPKDITKLTDETIIFTGLYATFLQTCEDNPEACRGMSHSIHRLKIWADTKTKRLQVILDEGDALNPSSDKRHSVRTSAKAHWKWLVRRNVVAHLLDSLSVARQSIEGFTNIMCIRKLNETLAELRGALKDSIKRRAFEEKLGMPLEAKIRSLQAGLKIRKSVHRTTARMLVEAQQKVKDTQTDDTDPGTLQSADAALDFAAAFEDYAEEVLPSTTPGSSNHSKTSFRASFIRESVSRPRHQPVSSQSLSSSDSGSSVSGHIPRTVLLPSRPAAHSPAPQNASIRHQRPPATPRNTQTNAIVPSGGASIFSTRTTQVNAPKQPLPRPQLPQQPPRSAIIGGHVVTLRSDSLHINSHFCLVSDYDLTARFFNDLLTHGNELGALARALRDGAQEDWWGVAGWRVHLGNFVMRRQSAEVRDV